MAVPDYFGLFYLGVLHVHVNVHCVHVFFNVRHSETQFSWQVLVLFGPENSPAPFPGGVSDVEPEFFAVLRSARRVCAVLKI